MLLMPSSYPISTIIMERFNIRHQLGEGSFGRVYYAVERATDEERAIKVLRRSADLSAFNKAVLLREVQSLLHIPQHPHLVRLYEIHWQQRNVFLVFEYLQHGSLYQEMQRRRHPGVTSPDSKVTTPDGTDCHYFTETEIASILRQVLQALQHMHQHGYYHRDIKPENILLGPGGMTKLADLSVARPLVEYDPHDGACSVAPPTPYVSTRWYRAPEVILDLTYTGSVDIWALGCLGAELFTFETLLCGGSNVEQLRLILQLTGSCAATAWPDGHRRLRKYWPDTTSELPMHDRAAQMHRLQGSMITGPAPSTDAVNVLCGMMQLVPSRRATAAQALQHAFFRQLVSAASPLPTVAATTSIDVASVTPESADAAVAPIAITAVVNPYLMRIK